MAAGTGWSQQHCLHRTVELISMHSTRSMDSVLTLRHAQVMVQQLQSGAALRLRAGMWWCWALGARPAPWSLVPCPSSHHCQQVSLVCRQPAHLASLQAIM